MKQLVKVFKALSDSNRIRILKMLEVRSLCVCEITTVLELATSTVSKHLSLLRDAEFIMDEKEGKWVNYRLNTENTNTYISHLLPFIQESLPSDKQVKRDYKKVFSVDRNKLCKI